MDDSFHIELGNFPLDQYKETLKRSELIPSRRILQENTDERFSRLQAAGIDNLEQLLAAMRNPGKIAELGEKTGLSPEYLTILRREVNSLIPKPKYLREFPGVARSLVERLAGGNINNTRQLLALAGTRQQRSALAGQAHVEEEELLELVKLADLSRVYGVGPVFARLLLDSGIDSVAAIAGADPRHLFDALAEAYLAAGNSRVDFQEKDIAFCIRMARRLPAAFEP